MGSPDFIKAEVRACTIGQYMAQLVNSLVDLKHASEAPFGRGSDTYREALKEDIASIRTALDEVEALAGLSEAAERSPSAFVGGRG